MHEGHIGIPESMRLEHEEIHEDLVRAKNLEGRVGDAARELARVLHPHFIREEEIALPPLGLLEPLSKAPPTPAMREVLRMTDALRAELPRMLEEHEAIGAAARRLEAVAREERNSDVEKLAKKLQLHARSEEEHFYPAALIVGDMVKGAEVTRRANPVERSDVRRWRDGPHEISTERSRLDIELISFLVSSGTARGSRAIWWSARSSTPSASVSTRARDRSDSRES